MSRIDHIRTQADVDALRADLEGPLIEPLGGGRSLATFCWFGDEEAVSVLSPLTCRFQLNTEPLRRVEGTDLWYRSVEIPDDLRTVYAFCIGPDPYRADILTLDADEETEILLARMPQMRADPLNPRTIRPYLGVLPFFSDPPGPDIDPATFDSVIEGSDAVRQPPVEDREHVEHTIGERRVWVHVPDGVDRSSCPIVFLLDGRAWIWIVPAASIVGAHGAATVLVGNLTLGSRNDEHTVNEAFTAHLADEVLPFVRREHGLHGDVIIGGASLGGLGSACAATYRPDTFRGVLSMSGSFWWGPPGEPEYLARQPLPDDVRWYLSVGAYDPDVLPHLSGLSMESVTRRFAAAIGEPYRVFPGGHDFASWRTELDLGLRALLSRA